MITDRFEVPSRLKTTGIVLLLIGVAALVGGFAGLLSGNEYEQARFWTVLLQNSVFFLFISSASIFIQAAAGLAQGGWIVAYRRVPEAIGANVWVFGLVALVVLFSIVFGIGEHNPVYHWVHPHGDKVLEGKATFLNKGMFAGFSIVTIGLWSWFGIKFRAMSLAEDIAPRNSTKIYWKMVAMSGAFLFVYALTMMSTTPWFWIMSIDAHWYSTLFSWYVFASSFVSGMALILLWTVYLKNRGNLEFVNKEHMHDLGKFMFAFSIFWTYLWFAQFMLIWYANIPEETTYFKIRMQGPYAFFFWANLILNFVLPILILMTRPSKRNYFTVVFMAMTIIFGHWIDFYVMTMPGPLQQHWHLNWYELGIACGFIGLMILVVSRTLAKTGLVLVNNPFLKETLIHVS
ncbi:quinol:cytochrome C oxidoreductase [Taibaiella koreensis]|uniref:quinol:cytochrome C oxidoreductase n=1 Tax=Taibaiella koreensis TaxID=1268548 RepID=UPI000E5992F7|nr:quinol:cytochrome C oxidoreductase [Taibaiella koreensis]